MFKYNKMNWRKEKKCTFVFVSDTPEISEIDVTQVTWVSEFK